MRSSPIAGSLALLFLLLLAACAERAQPAPDAPASSESPVKTGAEVLVERNFDLLTGKRVGLIVNHTAVVDSTHIIDLIHAAPDVEVTALFGPEHGIRGTADAGEVVADGRDPATGAPIYSLYGDTRKPTPEMLENVDVLVFDIQDVGTRFYTYISTMGLAMQAAAEQGIPFVVLDRPNPIGGTYVSGFVLEPGFESFVGAYAIPMAYGLTIGELANMIKEAGLMDGLDNLDLEVVELEGWTRDMLWPDTGLEWISPSPNIPIFETALVYPGAVLFEGTTASEGRGTYTPFLVLGAPWADGDALAESLNSKSLPGVRFEAASFTPVGIEGMAANPKLKGVAVEGIRYEISDPRAFKAVETGIHVLHAFYQQAKGAGIDDFVRPSGSMDRLAGTDRLRLMLADGASPEEIIASWSEEVERFREARQPYLLYGE